MRTPRREAADAETGAPEGTNDTQDVTSTDVATIDAALAEQDTPGTAVAVASHSPELTHYLQSSEAVAAEDPEQVAFEIVQRILTASSVDDVLRRTQVLSAEDVQGFPLRVINVRWHKSAYDAAERMYALIEAERIDMGGEPVLIACGGRNVMAQLWRLGELDAFPCDVKITKAAKATGSGYYPFWLEPSATF